MSAAAGAAIGVENLGRGCAFGDFDINAFQPPLFLPPKLVSREEMDARMDAGLDTFALNIPPNFQQDVLAGRSPRIQLNTDATRVSQAFSGSGYVQTIVTGEVQTWSQRYRSTPTTPVVEVQDRVRYNANLTRSWFGGVVALIDMITMLSVLLTGSALIRERERGTVEHLLVMPVTPAEIMTSKVWSMGLVVLVASALSMKFVVQGWLGVPIQGSVPLFVCGTALHVFAVTSLGMFLATFARTMPQFALLMIMVLLPLQMLSGGMTPRESMPEWVQQVMLAAPTTHFVMLVPGDPVPRRGDRGRLAAVPRTSRHRHGPLRRRTGPLPQDHWHHGVIRTSLYGFDHRYGNRGDFWIPSGGHSDHCHDLDYPADADHPRRERREASRASDSVRRIHYGGFKTDSGRLEPFVGEAGDHGKALRHSRSHSARG